MRRLSRTKKNMLRRKAARRRGMVPVIAFVLLLSMALQTFAFTPNTNKEEVIYVNLNLDGSVDAIYVVNSFDLSKDGKIIDYGDYTAFRQLTESSDITMENETITINAAAGKVYYEGKMRNESIPWDFSIKYYLDGREYTGQEIAGKSGNLKINIDIGDNPAYLGGSGQDGENAFFKNLTLQMGLTLDTSKAKNIEAEGAVIANAGRNKQVTFTVLPGRESSFTIKAQVSNFEMDGISINGIPLNMDFDIEDDPEMTKEMKKLKDGVTELDDGARELRDGVKDLREGTEELRDGVEELKDGVIELADGTKELRENMDEFVDGTKELDDGVADLKKGTKDLKDGTKELDDGMGKLASGASRLRSGASDLAGGLGEAAAGGLALVTGAEPIVNIAFNAATFGTSFAGMVNVGNYENILGASISTMQSEIANYIEYTSGTAIREMIALGMGIDLSTATEEELAIINNVAIEQIENLAREQMEEMPEFAGIMELMKLGMFYDGVASYTSGVSLLASGASELSSGISDLYSGLRKIDRGTADLREGVEELYDGVVDLKDGTAKLLDGAIELKDGIIELDDGVIELKDGVLELFDGAIELHDGVIELHDGTIEMAKGTMEFKDKTADLEETLTDKIKEKIDEMLGRNFKAKSFVSEKNTNIESVQFVMKTADIVIVEAEQTPAEPAKPIGFFDRLLALFTFLTP